MRKFSVATLLVKLVCLQVLCQPLSVLAESGSGGGAVDECAADPTKYSLDANGDERVDISDIISSLTWMFGGGQVPQVCLDTTDLEVSLAAAEGERDVALADLTVALADLTTTQGALTTAEAALAALQHQGRTCDTRARPGRRTGGNHGTQREKRRRGTFVQF